MLNHLGTAETLDFLRTQLAKGPEQYRAQYAQQLFQTLLDQPWSADYENEAFTCWQRLSDAESTAERDGPSVAALYQMTDRMVQARYHARMKAVEHQEKLTRTELRAKQEENLKAARQGYADRLREEMSKHRRAAGPVDERRAAVSRRARRRDLDKAAEECFDVPRSRNRPKATASRVPRLSGWTTCCATGSWSRS